jgi:hypothetical protein
VKLANYGDRDQSVTVKFADESFDGDATLSTVSGSELVANYPGIVSVTPQDKMVSGSAADGYTFVLPAWGVGVLAVDV